MHTSSMHCRRLAAAMWRWPQASAGTVQGASNAASHRAPLRCFSRESGGSDDSSLASRIWRRLLCCRDSYCSLPDFSGTHGPGLIAVWRVRVSRLHKMIQLQELWYPQPQSRGIVRQGLWHNNSLYSGQHQALQHALCCNCKSAATCRCLQLHCKEGPYFLVACSL